MMEDIVKGYIAGFFDGEGSVVISKDKRCDNYGLRVSVPNTNYDVLRRIKLKCSGNISEEKLRKKKNCELGKQKWQWNASSDNASEFLQYIRQYSVVKRRQIELGIRFFSELKDCSGWNKVVPLSEIQKREWFYNEMKRLNHEKYDEKIIKDYDNEIRKLKIPKDIREGKQLVISKYMDRTYADMDEIYKMHGIERNDEILKDEIISMSGDAFIGYCAGFFDAEGCVRITENYTLTLFIKQTKYDILKMVYDKYGGIVEKTRKMEKTDIGNERKQQWVWRVNSNDCVPFLKSILDFSIVKNPQIDIAIKYQTLVKTRHNPNFGRNPLSSEEISKREWYRQKLTELKKQNSEDMDECYDTDAHICNKGERTLADFD